MNLEHSPEEIQKGMQDYEEWTADRQKTKPSPNTPMALIEISEPRWKGRVIGIASYRIQHHNKIRITATNKDGKRYFPNDMYMSGENIKRHTTQLLPGGTVLYLVPINELETL